jgi:hypothetical protein
LPPRDKTGLIGVENLPAHSLGIFFAKSDPMNTRIKPQVQGDVVKVRSLPQYPLPLGLAECEEVTILEIKQGARIVADRNGRLHEIPMVCVVAGVEYREGDQWLPPSHPAIAQRLASGR